jgi:hypothetical protein
MSFKKTEKGFSTLIEKLYKEMEAIKLPNRRMK